ncbi:MAG: hypothetical protein LBJ19_02435 [Holosporaceae bacterium]|jgi:hypothetical protein|nr:hypothetical protein [Holosporaceae bacterium]
MKNFLEKIVLHSINTLKNEMVNVLQEAEKSLSPSSTAEQDGQAAVQIPVSSSHDDTIVDSYEKSAFDEETEQSITTISTGIGNVQRIVLNPKPPLAQEKLSESHKKNGNDGENYKKNNTSHGEAGGETTNRSNVFSNPNTVHTINAYSRNRRLNIMIVGAVVGLIICMLILSLYQGELPGEVVGIISTVSGIFGSCLKDAYSFEFGSSRGSKDKDEKISSGILATLNNNNNKINHNVPAEAGACRM